ncbi:hypothetical protein quinque_001005 [Culex quinquefasciatus]
MYKTNAHIYHPMLGIDGAIELCQYMTQGTGGNAFTEAVRRMAKRFVPHFLKPCPIVDLLVTLSTLLRGSVYERLRWTFRLYDINNDGCISRAELSEIVLAVHELMGRRPHQPDDDRKAREQVDHVFRKLDLNQDGIITIEEFLEACLKDDVVTKSLQMFDTCL